MRPLALLLVVPLLASVNPSYREALPGYRFHFPLDHFEHPEFRTEWWYYTGNVWSADGHRFGFELVFFRIAERTSARDNPLPWRVDDVYLSHAALTDVNGKHFSSHERLNRAGPGIAGASFAVQRVWNGNWSSTWKGEQQSLSATTEDFSFRLSATPAKPLVIQGENGVSQKAEGAGHASYYVSFPLLAITGEVQTGGHGYKVSGQAWMDHEWFTHQLQSNQTGWDWFSVQLDDKTEMMLFEIRRKDGSVDPFSSGTYIARDGTAHHLRSEDFTLQALDLWQSSTTGARYPIRWSIHVPSLHIELECRATLRDQELTSSHGANYWEGAVDYSGSQHGVGYLEMTGYDKPVKLE